MSLVMDFLHGAGDVAQGIADPFEYLGKNAIVDPARQLAAQVTGNQQAGQNAEASTRENLGLGQSGTDIGSALKGLASNTAQVGLDVAAPGIAKGVGTAVEGAADLGTSAAGKVASGVIKGAAEGAAIGGPQGVAQGIGQKNGKSLAMDFIQGAGEGAATGGVLGGAAGAVSVAKGAVQPVFAAGKPSDQFTSGQLDRMAKSDSTVKIANQLKPVVGDVVAQKIAPAIAATSDHNVISNIVDNAVNQHLAPATPDVTGTGPVSPSPAPVPASTPVSDINTPAQVAEQGSAAEATYNPQSDEESLAQSAPQVPPSFMNDPGAEAPQSSHVSTLAANTGMHDILNGGGTTDEALTHYMNTTGANYGDAQKALSKLISDSGTDGSLDRSKINASLNPQSDKVSFPEATSKEAAVLGGNYARTRVNEVGTPALQAMEQLNPHDMALVRELKGNNPGDILAQANDKVQFEKVMDSLKNYNDYTQAAGAELGQPIPYRQNYGLRTPYAPPEAAGEGAAPANLPDLASYTKGRVYNTHAEAIANGETPIHETALQDLQSDVAQRSHDQAQLALAKGLEQTYPGQVKIINNGQIPSGYHQLLIPGGDKIFMPKEVADDINTREMSKPASGLIGKYDSVNQAGKSLELGGGAFHAFNTGGIFAGQQLTSGQLFKDPSALGHVVANMFSDTSNKNYWDALGKAGTYDANHSIKNMLDAVGASTGDASADIGKPEDTGISGKVSSLPIIKQIHEAIFKRQIPTMIAETIRQRVQDANLDIFGNAADREEGIKIAKSVNQSYGSLNRDIQGLTPKQFQAWSRVGLAVGYQEGQIRTLLDAVSKGGAEGNIARQAVFGKALVFGGLATLGAAAGGDFKGQTPKQVALAIMNKSINPSFDIAGYKVGLPATQISNIAKPVEETIAGAKAGKGVFTGAEDFANSHLAFAPSKAIEVGTNKDFEGNAIYGSDYFGRPISPLSTAANLASGVLPIPLAQATETATGNQSTGAAIANTAGFNAQPQYDLNYAPIAGQTYIQQLEKTPGVTKQQLGADTQFMDLLGVGSKGKSKVITQAETDIKAGNPQKADAVIAKYNQKLAAALLPWAQSGGTKYLDSNMLSLLKTAQITYKKANENVAYLSKTNPTSIGAPIEALAQPTNQSTNQGV